MRCIKLIVAALGMLLVVAPITKAATTYIIQNYPADQNGATVAGSITTDGTIGVLSSTDILSWVWSISNPGGPSGGGIFPALPADSAMTLVSGLVATNTQLLLPAPTTPSGNPNVLDLEFQLPTPSANALLWERFSQSSSAYVSGIGVDRVWNTTNPAMGGTDPWVIAAVPEPSSFLLAVLGAVCVIAYGLARSRGVARTIS
jgi:hypothetical protein